jgi:uncharacterized protein YggE
MFGNYTKHVVIVSSVLLGVLALFFLAKTVNVIKENKFIGGGTTATNTITVSGKGEAYAIPDVARISITMRFDSKTFSDTQAKITAKEKQVLDILAAQGIDKKDIKTDSYNIAPKYEWQNDKVVCTMQYPSVCPPSNGRNVQVGFEGTETLAVKIRKTDTVGAIVDAISKVEVSEIGQPEYTVDDEDKVKAEARDEAIADAKAKAEVLAKSLGVKIIRVVNFSEDTQQPYMQYARADAIGGAMMVKEAAAPVPELPKGENKYAANVNIVYEIR